MKRQKSVQNDYNPLNDNDDLEYQRHEVDDSKAAQVFYPKTINYPYLPQMQFRVSDEIKNFLSTNAISKDEKTRRLKIFSHVQSVYNQSKKSLVDKGYSFAKVAEMTDYDFIIYHVARDLAEKGFFQNNPTRQKSWISKGRTLLIGAQLGEIGYSAGNVALTLYQPDFKDPYSITTGILSIVAAPFQLGPNVAGVNPGSGVIDDQKTDDPLGGLDGDFRDLIAPKVILDQKTLGCKNKWDAEFLLVLMKYTVKQADDYYALPSSIYALGNYFTFVMTNLIASVGNYMWLAPFVKMIPNPWIRISFGLTTLTPIVLIGFIYYTAFTLGKIFSGNQQMFSSRNPIIQTAKISWPLAVQSLYDFLSNCLLRGVSVAATFEILLEDFGLNTVFSESEWSTISTWLTTSVLAITFYNTLSTRASVYRQATQALTFPTHVGQSQTITDTTILDWKGIRPYVKSKLTWSDTYKMSVMALVDGVCYTTPGAILIWNSYGLEQSLYIGSFILAATTSIVFYNQRNSLVNSRASGVIAKLRGRFKSTKLPDHVFRFIHTTLMADTLERILSRSATVIVLPFIANLGLPSLALQIGCIMAAIPSAKNEYKFYQQSSEENSPELIKNIQDYAEKDPDQENDEKSRRCCSCQRLQIKAAKALVTIMPWFFKPSDDQLPNTDLETKPSRTTGRTTNIPKPRSCLDIIKRTPSHILGISREIVMAEQEIVRHEAESGCSIL